MLYRLTLFIKKINTEFYLEYIFNKIYVFPAGKPFFVSATVYIIKAAFCGFYQLLISFYLINAKYSVNVIARTYIIQWTCLPLPASSISPAYAIKPTERPREIL